MYIIPQFIKWLKNNPVALTVSAVHALWMLLFTFIWINQPFTWGDELFLIQMTSGIKRIIFKTEEKPDKKDFLFINVAYDRELIPKLDDDGFPVGNQDITDREKLSEFFHILNKNPNTHKFIICDIFFKYPSPHDGALEDEIQKLKNILIPLHKNKSGQWDFPNFSAESGLADYTTADTKGTFLKFTLMEDEQKTIPLLMYEKLHHAKFQKNSFGYTMNGKYSLNSIILDFRIRNCDLFQSKEPYLYVNLGELLRAPQVIREMVNDRIVIIGDFEIRDMHETVLGDMAGSLILLNTYLSLLNEDNIISVHLLIFLFFIYLIISYNMFYSKRIEEHQWTIRIIRSVIRGKVIAKLFNYIITLGFVSVICYFIFNIHINILFIATYLTMLGHGVRYIREKRKFNG